MEIKRPPAPARAAPSTPPGAGATSSARQTEQRTPATEVQADPGNGRGAAGSGQDEQAQRTREVNRLLALDLDADGALTRRELAPADSGLQLRAPQWSLGLKLLGPPRDDPEQVALRYEVADGYLRFVVPDDSAAPDLGRIAQERLPHTWSPEALGLANLKPVGGYSIVHGEDPGNYYCEHLFFAAQVAASQPGSSIASNRHGEPLVGFLHVPYDEQVAGLADESAAQARRHAGLRVVIGAALAGYFEELFRQGGAEPTRVIVSGYGPFMSIQDNPSGDFVVHPQNIDAAMAYAFGDDLLTPFGLPLADPAWITAHVAGSPRSLDFRRLRYKVRDATGRERTVELLAVRFPVDDQTISPDSPRSLQRLIEHSGARAVISMGVGASPGEYQAEHRADSGGLRRSSASSEHDWGASDRVRLRDNYSLARAIIAGAERGAAPRR